MALNAEVLTSYKQIDEAYIDELLKKEIEKNNKKIVVLDDDPTGVRQCMIFPYTQTGKKIPSVRDLMRRTILFYILTNSRGFTAEQTTKAHNEIAAVVDEVAKETGKEYIIHQQKRFHSPWTLSIGDRTSERKITKLIPERRLMERSSARSLKKAEDLRSIMYIM